MLLAYSKVGLFVEETSFTGRLKNVLDETWQISSIKSEGFSFEVGKIDWIDFQRRDFWFGFGMMNDGVEWTAYMFLNVCQ